MTHAPLCALSRWHICVRTHMNVRAAIRYKAFSINAQAVEGKRINFFSTAKGMAARSLWAPPPPPPLPHSLSSQRACARAHAHTLRHPALQAEGAVRQGRRARQARATTAEVQPERHARLPARGRVATGVPRLAPPQKAISTPRWGRGWVCVSPGPWARPGGLPG